MRLIKKPMRRKRCACGCGKLAKLGKIYLFNHQKRGSLHSEETKRKLRDKAKVRVGPLNGFYGKHHSEETKRKLSKKRKGRVSAFLGKHHSEEAKKKMSDAHKSRNPVHVREQCACGCGGLANIGRTYIIGHYWKCHVGPQQGIPVSEETKRKISESHKGLPGTWIGKHHSEETKEKIRKDHLGKHFTEEHCRKLSLACKGRIPWIKGKHHTVETKRKLSQAQKKLWLGSNYRENQLRAIFSSCEMIPTRPEKQLRHILKDLFPGEYKYVGDGDVWIGGKNPDFININGQKKIIELFGDYWHSQEITGINNTQHRKQREKHFAKYGYRTLIVWEYQLSDRSKLERKLNTFHTM